MRIDKTTLFMLFTTIFLAMSTTFSFFAQEDLQNINRGLQMETLSYMPFLVQQNLFLMEVTTSEEPICNNPEKVRSTLMNLQNESEEIYNQSISISETINQSYEKYRKDTYLSIIFLFIGLIFAVITIWTTRKCIK